MTNTINLISSFKSAFNFFHAAVTLYDKNYSDSIKFISIFKKFSNLKQIDIKSKILWNKHLKKKWLKNSKNIKKSKTKTKKFLRVFRTSSKKIENNFRMSKKKRFDRQSIFDKYKLINEYKLINAVLKMNWVIIRNANFFFVDHFLEQFAECRMIFLVNLFFHYDQILLIKTSRNLIVF